MRLPYINVKPMNRKLLGQFGGVNEQKQIADNEFSEMKNMSSRFFPAIGTREPRGAVIASIEKPNGLYYKNGLAYVDGTSLYYKGKVIAEVEDSEKQMVGLGAYLCVFPDKIVYNTHTGELDQIEKSWTQTASVTMAPLTTASTYIKISSTGIGKNFSQYDAVTISGCTVDELNKTAVIQDKDDDFIVVIGSLEDSTTQTSGITVKRTGPDLDFVAELDNRLWGCSSESHEIYASKLGDPLNWNAFEGISTDSYAATVGTDGDFTGAVSHLGYILFFKEDTIHKVYGNKPSNIQITSLPLRGVAKGCEKSLCIVNETLYYASRNNICSYEGSMPYSISDDLRSGYVDATAGQYGDKYYISLKYGDEWKLYVYDPAHKAWHCEDDTQMLYAAYGEGVLYYIDQNGNLRTIADESEDERIEWSLESGDLLEGDLNKKHLVKLQLLIELAAGGYAEVFFKTAKGGLWQRLTTLQATQKETYSIPLMPNRSTYYRYKIQGTGQMILYGLGKSYKEGSGR